jgi:hypothetical protein
VYSSQRLSERATGQYGRCRQRPGRAVEKPLAAGAEGGDSSGTWIEVGPAAVMDGHAGSAGMWVRIAKSRQGMPTVCAAVRCAPRKSAILASLNGLGTQAAALVSTGHSVASTNRHRIQPGGIRCRV